MLASILRGQRELLDHLFGSGAYQIGETDADVAEVRTAWMAVLLTYDPRDQWVSSMTRPLQVEADLSGFHPTDTWLRFYGILVGVRRRSVLDVQQVTDELILLRPLVELFKDEQKSRDAAWFVRGYAGAYTDWASGNWD